MGGGDHDFLAPSSLPVEPASQRMTNADFRKLMMTPRAGQTPAPPTPGGENTPGGGAMSGGRSGGATPRSVRMDKGKAEERRKKKTYYAKLKKDEDDKMAELAEKYRDRARERRDGGEPGVVGEESTNAYRAVAPNARETHDAAERRRQMIHESKYLGGDMEHTHLVKGLDFALLQKVRSEIESREQMEEEEEEENEEDEKEVEKKVESKKEVEKVEDHEEDKPAVECRTVMGKNIMRLMLKSEGPKVNELFMPGRMAYVMDLEDEGESDIPTTSIRSKKDVINNEQKATLSTNDIVINKLTQILSYLRAGNRTKKKKKDKMGDLLGADDEIVKGASSSGTGGKGMDLPIYDDVGDYKPRKEDKKDRRDDRRDKDRGRDGDKRRDDRRDRDRDRDKYREGRDKDRWSRGEDKIRKDKEHDGGSKYKSYFDKPQEREKEQRGFTAEDKEMIKALMKKEEEKEKQKDDKKLAGMMQSSSHDGYAECYPGLAEMDDAIGDSDDEADFSKMDMGNKKGPVGRWDFDTAEEYGDYMGSKEAMPKAAFQYGMKMSDGRKTRGQKVGAKNEKAKLDKEWNKISALIDKRKSGGGGGGANKKQRYDYE